jgi:uncharacterized membrane protein
LSFSLVIFVAALWALSSEMLEDSLVDLIYGHIYGWRNVIYALLSAALILVTVSSVLVYYASLFLVAYTGLISKGAAILLAAVGLFWLISSILDGGGETKMGENKERRGTRANFIIVLQLVFIEELELFLILVPLILASHVFEAVSAAAIGVLASVSLAAFLRKGFERFVVGRMRYLKVVSGLFLVGLGLVLYLEL